MKNTAKRLLALGMTLSIAVGMLPVPALAADQPSSFDFRGKSGEQIKASWSVAGGEDREDTALWSPGDSGITLTTHDGDIHTGSNSAKNVFMQKDSATGDWVVETMITLDDGFDNYYQQGAILAYENDDHYVKLSYEYNPGTSGDNANPMIVQLASEVNNTTIYSDKKNIPLGTDADTVVYLRLIKSGTDYSGAYSFDGVTFTEVPTSYSNPMTAPKIALAAFNGGVTGNANKDVTFAYVAAMTAERAAAVATLETAINALPANVDAVTTDNFAAIDAAKAQYDDLSDLALRDTLVNQSAHLNALVAKVAAMRANIAAANAVVTKINAIGTVALTDTSKALITEARTAYNGLTDAQKALVTEAQLAVLTKAEADYDALAAADVDAKIEAIGTVNLSPESTAAIKTARDAYNALTDAQKEKVTKLETLTAAEAARTALANKYDFVTAVADIGTTITKDSKAKIDAAETAYGRLTDAQKTEVGTNYATLTTAKTVYGVVEKIEAIGTVAVTSDCKTKIDAARAAFLALDPNTLEAMVGNYSTLQDAEKVYSAMSLINDIGTVSLNSKDKIAAARTAYNGLTSAQKEDVTNYNTLKAAEVSYTIALINDIGTVTLDSKTKIEAARTAYNNLVNNTEKGKVTNYSKLTAAEAALADLTAADAVDAKIAAIGTVEATTACKAKIDAARTAYDALTTAQKALVKKYDDLTNAEQLYALLAALEGPCDGGTNCPAYPFVDVDPTQWYHAAVDYALDEGLFKGVSATQFAPNGTMTRAMIWTVLARMDDATLAVTNPWYKSAQNWAVNNQVSDGTTPDGSVTREQLVTMLWRFMDEPDANGTLGYYPDSNKVSSWAKEAMTWAVANGVVNGVGNANGTVTLDPGATATRAQVAQMFMNFLNK